MSGPSAAIGNDNLPAETAAVAYINAHGGINGRKLKNIVLNVSCTDSQNAVQVGRTLLESDKVFLLWGDQCAGAVDAVDSTLLAGTDIVNFTTTAGARFTGSQPNPAQSGYTFYFNANTSDQMADVMNWAKQTGQVPLTKLGVLNGTDSYGADGAVGVKAAAPADGAKIVDTETADETATNVQVQMAKLKAAGATTIALIGLPGLSDVALSAALQLNYHPFFLTAEGGSSFQFLKSLPPAAWAKLYGASPSPWPSGSAAEKAQIAMLQPYASTTLTSSTYGGLGGEAYLMLEVISKYLQRAGTDLTRQSFLKALYAGPIPGATNGFYPTIQITSGGPLELNRSVYIDSFSPTGVTTQTPTRYAPNVKIPGIDIP